MDNSRVFSTGLLSIAEGRRIYAAVFAAALVLGLVLCAVQTWALLPYGLAGILGGWLYTGGPRPYKYDGLGDPLIVWLMGPLLTQGAYTAITGDAFSAAAFWVGPLPRAAHHGRARGEQPLRHPRRRRRRRADARGADRVHPRARPLPHVADADLRRAGRARARPGSSARGSCCRSRRCPWPRAPRARRARRARAATPCWRRSRRTSRRSTCWAASCWRRASRSTASEPARADRRARRLAARPGGADPPPPHRARDAGGAVVGRLGRAPGRHADARAPRALADPRARRRTCASGSSSPSIPSWCSPRATGSPCRGCAGGSGRSRATTRGSRTPRRSATGTGRARCGCSSRTGSSPTPTAARRIVSEARVRPTDVRAALALRALGGPHPDVRAPHRHRAADRGDRPRAERSGRLGRAPGPSPRSSPASSDSPSHTSRPRGPSTRARSRPVRCWRAPGIVRRSVGTGTGSTCASPAARVGLDLQPAARRARAEDPAAVVDGDAHRGERAHGLVEVVAQRDDERRRHDLQRADAGAAAGKGHARVLAREAVALPPPPGGGKPCPAPQFFSPYAEAPSRCQVAPSSSRRPRARPPRRCGCQY